MTASACEDLAAHRPGRAAPPAKAASRTRARTGQARSLDQNRRYRGVSVGGGRNTRSTGSGWAPWTVVEATDPFHAWRQVCETRGGHGGGLQARGIDLDRLGEQTPADGDAAGAP